MKKKKIIILIVLILIAISTYFLFFNKPESSNNFENFEKMQKEFGDSGNFSGRSKEEKSTTLSQTSEVKSASIEKIEPHATYYLEELYVETNQYIEAGANILKYTNGTYLVAPYNCCITEINLPEISKQCLNSHYIQISGTNVLSVSMNVDESKISQIELGKEAKIEINALNKTYTGYITHIGSTASNGKFEITIEFENDQNIKLAMTSTVSITI